MLRTDPYNLHVRARSCRPVACVANRIHRSARAPHLPYNSLVNYMRTLTNYWYTYKLLV